MSTIKDYKDGLKENTRGFVDELKTKFPDLRITSGFRPRAFTKQGNMSRHALGEAIDIAPDKKVYDYLWNTKEGIALLDKYGLGVLDETTPEMLEKTGGTGAHYHIGMDSTIVPKTKARYKELWGEPVQTQQIVQTEKTPQLQTSELSYLADTSLFSNFEEDKDVAEVENKIQEQKQNEYNFLVDLIQNTQAQYIEPTEDFFKNGGEKNSLWKNIRENRGSGKKPTKEMLEQERKIKNTYEEGGIPISKDGVFASDGKPVIVPSPSISLKGVSYPIIGKSLETGETKMMLPEMEYFFKNTQNVLETPITK
jgi:hypothetical protein